MTVIERKPRNNLAGIGRRDILKGEPPLRKHSVSSQEQETIITFNKEDAEAHVFTYEETWQRHFEKTLGIKPETENGFGGKSYSIDKKRIKMPHLPKKMTAEQKAKSAARLTKMRIAKKTAATG